jgi:hypothetical protein
MIINIYEQFIEYLKQKKYSSTVYLERHHIIPKHAGGTNQPENLIDLSFLDHTLAHYYRFLPFGALGDKLAFLMRQN